jgi:RNA-binding protein 26
MLGIEQSSTSPFPPTQIGASQYPFQNFRGNDRGRGGSREGGNANPSRRGGRAEFSSDRPNYDKSKTTIVVENIPEGKFTEDDVRGFFSQFGNILEVSMRPYKRLAIVKYETWDSAKDAYSSPKVIFDNRFVKVYWYTNDQSLPQAPSTGANGTATNEANKDMSAVAPSRATSEPKIDIEEFARKQQEVQKAHEEKMKKKAEMEAAREEMNKRQEELLKRQAEEKRKLIEKLAAKSAKAGTPPSVMPNGESTEGKPISQAELLKAQLAALEAEAQSLGIDTASSEEPWSGRGRGRGRGGYRGRGAYVPRGGDRGGYRGRGGAPFSRGGGAYKLDNRPKKIAITGADFTNPEKDESLRQYLLVSPEIRYSKCVANL